MASKTLYDILEVSLSASMESIRAAYERLSAKFSESSANPDVKLQAHAITEAFLTLGNPAKRAQYDKAMAVRSQSVIYSVEVVEPFWTLPKFIILLAVIVVFGGVYYKYNKDTKAEARLQAERVIAAAKAKEAEETAKAEEAQEQFELAKQRDQTLQQERQRREQDAASRRFDFEQRANRIENVVSLRSKEQDERRAQQQQQREDAQSAAAVRLRLAQEKAELCRKERERYGRAISC
jgi:colicin import membrane protein